MAKFNKINNKKKWEKKHIHIRRFGSVGNGKLKYVNLTAKSNAKVSEPITVVSADPIMGWRSFSLVIALKRFQRIRMALNLKTGGQLYPTIWNTVADESIFLGAILMPVIYLRGDVAPDATPEIKNKHGIYAYKTPRMTVKSMPFVVDAKVTLSGIILEHEDGVLRASKCRIDTLYLPYNVEGYLPVKGSLSDYMENASYFAEDMNNKKYPFISKLYKEFRHYADIKTKEEKGIGLVTPQRQLYTLETPQMANNPVLYDIYEIMRMKIPQEVVFRALLKRYRTKIYLYERNEYPQGFLDITKEAILDDDENVKLREIYS